MMRSASVTSTRASDRPAMSPSSHAWPAAPPPARTKARAWELPGWLVASTCSPSIGQFPCPGVRLTATPPEVVVELVGGVEKVRCSLGCPPPGWPDARLARAAARLGLQCGVVEGTVGGVDRRTRRDDVVDAVEDVGRQHHVRCGQL